MFDKNKNSGDYNSGSCNSGSCNSGEYNSGDCNSKHKNSGDYNSGSCNSGSYNSGYYNSGNYNTGNYNSGHQNSGDYNSGSCNSGNYNIGNYNVGNNNVGNYNTGNYNTGYFNTNNPKVRLFNQPTNLDFNDDLVVKMKNIIFKNIKHILTWVSTEDMSYEEKAKNPTYKTTGGYLKKLNYKSCWKKGWENMSGEDKQFIQSLPNFCPIIFKEITGINLVKEESKKKITLELTQEQIDKIQDIINHK